MSPSRSEGDKKKKKKSAQDRGEPRAEEESANFDDRKKKGRVLTINQSRKGGATGHLLSQKREYL